jgi:hypothetical protein
MILLRKYYANVTQRRRSVRFPPGEFTRDLPCVRPCMDVPEPMPEDVAGDDDGAVPCGQHSGVMDHRPAKSQSG